MATAAPNAATGSSMQEIFASLNAGAKTTQSSETTASADRFLTMLVTQLKNQDPLNPMDNAQITSQMAQINAVTGLEKVNTSILALQAQMRQSQVLQGAALVGHQVLVPGDALSVSDGVGSGAVQLAGEADTLKVDVLNASRQVVGTVELGGRGAGNVPFEFGLGRLDPGARYSFRVSASLGGTAVAATPLNYDRVQSVSTSDDTLTLMLERGGQLPVGQVLAYK